MSLDDPYKCMCEKYANTTIALEINLENNFSSKGEYELTLAQFEIFDPNLLIIIDSYAVDVQEGWITDASKTNISN
eukprot:scaffold552080_cov15-Prasinocladus_malaysianus.AAC.1